MSIKEALAPCNTQGESQAVIARTPTKTLSDFVKAVCAAEKYIDLTMRDHYLLNQIKMELAHREFKAEQPTFITPVKG